MLALAVHIRSIRLTDTGRTWYGLLRLWPLDSYSGARITKECNAAIDQDAISTPLPHEAKVTLLTGSLGDRVSAIT